MTLFLYSLTTIIWGTTWIAISLQNGPVDSLVSVFYRFALAGLTLMPCLLLMGKLQKTSLRDHLWFMLQGCCLFCFNFICFYVASKSMASGLLSIIFSAAIFFNAFNNRVFFGVRPTKSIYTAGLLGVVGLVLLFWQELQLSTTSNNLFVGIGLSMLGTFLFSLGNMISVKHAKNNINPLTSSAYGMNYGALTLLLIILISGTPFNWDYRSDYLWSLIYLSIPGSIIGFTAYLSLVNRIGANQAAYATVLFPVVALFISTLFEGYTWNWLNSSGLVLVLLGNAFALNLFDRRKKSNSK